MGNVYLAGNFSGTVVLGGTTLTSSGNYDIFVAKFNPTSNQFVWAQRAGGTRYEIASALAASGTSVYVAGTFGNPTASFGPATLTNAGSTDNSDVFVAKLADAGSAGIFVWAQRAGGLGRDFTNVLTVTGNNVFVAGTFGSLTVDFGPATLTNAGGNSGTYDVYVTKLTDGGSTSSFIWTQQAGGINNEQASTLAVSGTGVLGRVHSEPHG